MKMMDVARNISKLKGVLVMCSCAALCACASAVDRDRGTSVRAMIHGQIHDMQSAANPPVEGPQGMDGVAAIGKLEDIQRESDSANSAKQRMKDRVWTDRVKF